MSSQTANPKRIFRNFFLLFLSNVAGQVFYLAAIVHLARVFSPALFGLWNLGQAWMMYLFRGGEMGMEVIGIRSIAASAEDTSARVASDATTVRIVLACLLMLAMVFAVMLGGFPAGSEQLILIFSLAVFPMAIIYEWVFEAHQAVGIVGAARLLKGILFAVPVLLLVRDASGFHQAAWLYVASLSVVSLYVAMMAQRRYRLWPSRINWSASWSMLREAFPIGMASVLSQYSLFVGTILAGYLTTPERVGFYTASHRLIIFIWAYGIVTSNRVVLPQLARMFTESEQLFALFVKKYFRVLCVVAVPIAIAGVAGGPEIIRILYGVRYAEGIPVFQILSIALVIAVVRSVLEIGLIASHRQSLYMNGMIGLAVLYTVFTVAAFLLGDIAEVAWAAVLAELSYAVYLAAIFGSIRARDLAKLAMRPVLVGAGILALLMIAGLRSLPIVISAGSILYFGVLYATGELSRGDFALVLEFIGAKKTVPTL